MNKDYRYNRPIDYYFYLIALIVIIGLYVFVFGKIILTLFDNFQKSELISLFVLGFLMFGIIYLLIQIVRMFFQYDKIDNNKEIKVDNNNRILIIKQNGKELKIPNEDIDTVEIFEPSTAGYPMGNFSYIRLNLKLGESIIITRFTLPLGEIDLWKILKGVKRIRKTRFFNQIK
jgi:hypothetical protein